MATSHPHGASTSADVPTAGTGGTDLRPWLNRASRSWGWFAFFGVVSVAAGIIALVWPGPTLLVLAIVFGVELVVGGLFRLVATVADEHASGGTRALMAIIGLLGLFIGLYALRHVALTVLVLGVLLGIYWLIEGVVGLFAAIDHPGMPGRGWVAVSGGLGVLAGIILLAWPEISVLTLAIVAGIWLLVFGASQLSIAAQLRRMRPAH